MTTYCAEGCCTYPEGDTAMTDDHQGARDDARKRTAQGAPGVTLTDAEREALGRSVAAVINRHSWDAAAETADFDMADAILDDNYAGSSVGLALTVERIIAARVQQAEAEYAATHAPAIGAKIRAAIEADVLRRVADRFQREWPVYGDDWLRAEADRIEEGAR